MDFYNVLLAKKTNRVLQFGSLYERLFETWINRARQILKDLPTGSISTVTDAAELPLNALKVSVEAWQEGSGDPSPSNIRPIHGWSSASLYDTGVNLWDEEMEVGNIDTTTGANSYASNRLRSSNYIAIKGGAAITIVCPTNGRYFEYDANYNYIGNTQFSPTGDYVTITPSSNTAYIRFILSTNYGTTYNNDVSINYPSSDTSYHAYQGKQCAQQFPSTIYGAEWDVVGGVLNNQYACINIPTDASVWLETSNPNVPQGRYGYYTVGGAIPNCKYSGGDANPNNVIIEFNMAKKGYSASDAVTATTFTVGVGMANYQTNIWINTDKATKTEFLQWLSENPLQLKYPLATPTTIDLSPLSIRLLEGTNNLYADCGEVLSGKYWANV